MQTKSPARLLPPTTPKYPFVVKQRQRPVNVLDKTLKSLDIVGSADVDIESVVRSSNRPFSSGGTSTQENRIARTQSSSTAVNRPDASRLRSPIIVRQKTSALSAFVEYSVLRQILVFLFHTTDRNDSGQAHFTVKMPVRKEGGRSARLPIYTDTPT